MCSAISTRKEPRKMKTESRYRIHGPEHTVVTRIREDVQLAKELGYKVTAVAYETEGN